MAVTQYTDKLLRDKLLRQLNRFIIGTVRGRNYVKVIRLDLDRYTLLDQCLRDFNIRRYGEDLMYQHDDGEWGRKFMGVDIKVKP